MLGTEVGLRQGARETTLSEEQGEQGRDGKEPAACAVTSGCPSAAKGDPHHIPCHVLL